MYKKYFILSFLTRLLILLSGCKTQENIVFLKTQILDKNSNLLYFSGVNYTVPNQDNGLQKFKNTIPIIQKKEIVKKGMEGTTKTGLIYTFNDLGVQLEYNNYYSVLFDKTYTGELYHKDSPYSIRIGYTTIQLFAKSPDISLQETIQNDHKPLLKFSELSQSEKKPDMFSGEHSLEIINVYPLSNSPFFNQPLVIVFVMNKKYPERYYLITNVDASNENITHFTITK